MTDKQDRDAVIARLIDWYGNGQDGSAPTKEQWRRTLESLTEGPLTLVNLFKLREKAQYSDTKEKVSGQEAFDRYASVSVPAMERAGGAFLYLGPFAGTFLGEDEDWDMVVIGQYPDVSNLLKLFEDPLYRDAFHHRTAACLRQKVYVGG